MIVGITKPPKAEDQGLVASLRGEIKELKAKVVSLQAENKELSCKNAALAEETAVKTKASETISKLEAEKEALRVENGVFERLQKAYNDGYNQAIKTVQMFQSGNMLRGTPMSAQGGAWGSSCSSRSGAASSSRSSPSPPMQRE